MGITLTNLCGISCAVILSGLAVCIVGGFPVEPIWLMMLHAAALLLQGFALAGCLWAGTFDWVPVRPSLRWAMVLLSYLVIALVSAAVFPLTPAVGSLLLSIGGPLIAASYTILVANPRSRMGIPATAIRLPAILMGGVAAALATVSVPVTVETIQERWREAGHDRQKRQELRRERMRMERAALDRLRSLGPGADLKELLAVLSTDSDLARGEVLERIAATPGLSEQLGHILSKGQQPWASVAAGYVADYYLAADVSALCEPLGAHMAGLRGMLDGQLAQPWNRVYEYQRWTLKAFGAARKLSRLGCNLDEEREQWLRQLDRAPQGYLRDVLRSAAGLAEEPAQNSWITASSK